MPIDISQSIERVEKITREEFQQKYMKPQKPVIIKHFYGKDAPFYTKWTFDYFKKELNDITVGIYDAEETEVKQDRSYKRTNDFMKFGEYLDLVQTKPTTKRLFLFNIFKHKKELKKDFDFPDVTNNVVRSLPLVFFGGKGAITRIHQDMDMSNVFLTELQGKKRIVLFSPKYSALLHRFPFGVHSAIDIDQPDYNKFPGLNKVKGLEGTLEAGDTIFMPSGWWHHIEYLEPSIGMAMRSLAGTTKMKIKGAFLMGILTHLDDLFRYASGDNWQNKKEKIATKRALNALKKN